MKQRLADVRRTIMHNKIFAEIEQKFQEKVHNSSRKNLVDRAKQLITNSIK